MIQLSAQPLPGIVPAVRAAGFPLGTTSDFALALADLAGAPGIVATPPAPPGGVVPSTIPDMIGRQATAGNGKDLPDIAVALAASSVEPELPAINRPATIGALPTPPSPIMVAPVPLDEVKTPVADASVPAVADEAAPIAPVPGGAGSIGTVTVEPAPVPVTTRPSLAIVVTPPVTTAIITGNAQLPHDTAIPRPRGGKVAAAPVGPRAVEQQQRDEASVTDDQAGKPTDTAVTEGTAVVAAAPDAVVAAPAAALPSPIAVPVLPASVDERAVTKARVSKSATTRPSPVVATPTSPSVATPQPTATVTAARVETSGAAVIATPATPAPPGGRVQAPEPRIAVTPDKTTPVTTRAAPILRQPIPPADVPATTAPASPIAGPAPVIAGAPVIAPRPIARATPASPARTLPESAPALDLMTAPLPVPTTPGAVVAPLDPTPAAAERLTRAFASPATPAVAAPVPPDATPNAAPSPVAPATPVPPAFAVSPVPTPASARPGVAVPVQTAGAPAGTIVSPAAAPAVPAPPAPAVAAPPAPILDRPGPAPVTVTVVALPATPPPLPQTQPAAQAFAAAIFAAAAPVDPAAGNDHDPLSPVLASGAAPAGQSLPTIAVAAPGQGQQATLDLSRGDWMASMIDRIETLRDESGGVRETRMKLAPEALGNVEVSVRRDETGAIQVRIAADTPQARAMLAEAAPKLADMAEARGVKLGGSSVDSGNASADQNRREAPAPAAVQRRVPSAAANDTDKIASDSRLA